MSDLEKLQKELETVRRQENQLAEKLKKEQAAQYTALPKAVGLSTIDELIKALVQYASPRLKARFAAPAAAAPARQPEAAKAAGKPARRKRAKITDETRAKVKELVKAGKTGAEVAETLDISLPSVQNIKKALGLVTKRK